MNKRRMFAIAAAATATVLTGGLALAGMMDPASTVTGRQELMKGMGGHWAGINDYVEKGMGTLGDVRSHALAIAETAKTIPGHFPAGTSADDLPGKSYAKADIWADWEKFQAAADNLAFRARVVAAAAYMGDGPGIKGLFGKMGAEGCGGCHQPFRIKKE